MKTYKNLPKKISNLLLLKKKFLVPKFYFYKFAKYKINKKEILNKVRKEFNNVIIRSAYSEEDQDGLSNAGKFLSIPNIKSIDALKLDLSINRVVNSYKMQNPNNQYFILQEMVNKVSQSGVVFAKNEVNGVPKKLYIRGVFSMFL